MKFSVEELKEISRKRTAMRKPKNVVAKKAYVMMPKQAQVFESGPEKAVAPQPIQVSTINETVMEFAAPVPIA